MDVITGLRGVQEAIVIALVYAAAAIVTKVVSGFIPEWKWQEQPWAQAANVSLSVLFPVLACVLECYTAIDVPEFDVVCGAQGFFNAVLTGLIAFMAIDFTNRKVQQLKIWLATRNAKVLPVDLE